MCAMQLIAMEPIDPGYTIDFHYQSFELYDKSMLAILEEEDQEVIDIFLNHHTGQNYPQRKLSKAVELFQKITAFASNNSTSFILGCSYYLLNLYHRYR
jgi:hypothetical protein